MLFAEVGRVFNIWFDTDAMIMKNSNHADLNGSIAAVRSTQR
jgi:hypothetical protein